MQDDIQDATLRAVIAAFVFVTVLVLIVAFMTGCKRNVVVDDKAPGQPLDAHSVTEYDRPAWLPACDHAYKVIDRQTGQQWWLLVMHENSKLESYVCMPIEGSANGSD